MAHTTSNPKIHEGRNLKRFREMLSIKQDHLAFELGEDWNQQKISLLEQREKIDSDILEQVAAILKIPAEAIRNFDEQQAINIISNTFQQFHDQSSGVNLQPTYNVNPIEKWIEALEENKRLNAELLKAKDDQIKLLERLIGDR
ncbi:helix-turn-helix domain-containing protein [Dyadobacter arcticus]|uniref:Transcriptional regulator with XRE-family HTH domain n=1 Tax=Dyadobacter arcticus TaxID=1078754 RepID=A0ABX0UNP2_9BACT|nr:helix-turn-helix transcriptional regulator [Dyadobacter arcticus]NIJ54602.1 transcriptional regulator with XRE-family HTH domain [Dyadobacter arcticus]